MGFLIASQEAKSNSFSINHGRYNDMSRPINGDYNDMSTPINGDYNDMSRAINGDYNDMSRAIATEKQKKTNAKSVATCSVSIMLRNDLNSWTLLLQLLRLTYFRLFYIEFSMSMDLQAGWGKCMKVLTD